MPRKTVVDIPNTSKPENSLPYPGRGVHKGSMGKCVHSAPPIPTSTTTSTSTNPNTLLPLPNTLSDPLKEHSAILFPLIYIASLHSHYKDYLNPPMTHSLACCVAILMITHRLTQPNLPSMGNGRGECRETIRREKVGMKCHDEIESVKLQL